MGLIIFLAVLGVIVAILASCIKVVPQTYEYVIEFLGKYKNLLLDGNLVNNVFKQGNLEMQACLPCGLVLTEKLNNIFIGLRNDLDTRGQSCDNYA